VEDLHHPLFYRCIGNHLFRVHEISFAISSQRDSRIGEELYV